MRVILLLVLFVIIMVLQVISLKEGFGQPGVQVQMSANQPMYFVAAVPDYSAQQVEDDEWRLF